MSTLETMPNPAGSGLQFDESKFKLRSRKILGAPEVPTMIRFLVTKGIVKNEGQAVSILLCLCVVIVITTYFIFNSTEVAKAVIDPSLNI